MKFDSCNWVKFDSFIFNSVEQNFFKTKQIYHHHQNAPLNRQHLLIKLQSRGREVALSSNTSLTTHPADHDRTAARGMHRVCSASISNTMLSRYILV